MTTLRVPIRYGQFGSSIKVYEPTREEETFEAFFEAALKRDINIYTKLTDTIIHEYITTHIEPVSLYDKQFLGYLLQQSQEKSKPKLESISVIKPEIVGLGLGGALSFGLGIFALATHNIGLATVMAGPFLASILGFLLLWIGLRRKR